MSNNLSLMGKLMQDDTPIGFTGVRKIHLASGTLWEFGSVTKGEF